MNTDRKRFARFQREAARAINRLAAQGSFLPSADTGREFGFGYGSSSGYGSPRSYLTAQPGMFRCH